MPKIASIENMTAVKAEHPGQQLQAYSPTTGEQYSADPGDYWAVKPGWVMTDSEGEPMILGWSTTGFQEA